MGADPILFNLSGVNQLALDGPGKATFSWDDLGFDFDKTWRISDASLGIDIPRVDAGFDLVARAEARFFVEMGFDVGTADISYALAAPEITGNFGTRALNGEDLPFFRFTDARLDTGTIAFADGSIVPIAGSPAGNYVDVGVETELFVAIQNAGISANLPWPIPDIDIDFPNVTLINVPKDKQYLFKFDGNSDPITGDPDSIIDGSLYLPRLVGQSGEADPWGPVTTVAGAVLPTLAIEGDAVAPGVNGTFFNLQVDIDRALSSILGLPNLNDTISIADGFSLSYNLIDADFNIGLIVSQGLKFVVDGVGVAVDS